MRYCENVGPVLVNVQVHTYFAGGIHCSFQKAAPHTGFGKIAWLQLPLGHSPGCDKYAVCSQPAAYVPIACRNKSLAFEFPADVNDLLA